MPVINRFDFLLKEKARKENRKITYEMVKDDTGIALSTLSAWARNKIKKFDADVLDHLCDYLECEIKDLIIRVDNGKKPS